MLWFLSAALAAPVASRDLASEGMSQLDWTPAGLVAVNSWGEVVLLDDQLGYIDWFKISRNAWGVTVSPDGRLVADQVWRGRTSVYDTSTGKRVVKVPKTSRWSSPSVFPGVNERYLVVEGLVIERDVVGAERVVSGDIWLASQDHAGYRADGTPFAWVNGRLHLFEGTGERVLDTRASVSMVFAVDDGFVLTDWDGAVEHVSLDGDRATVHTGAGLSTVDVSRDGALLARVDATGNAVEVWDLQAGQRVDTIAGAGVYDVAFSPEGDRLASVWMDGALRVDTVSAGPALELGAAPGAAPVHLEVVGDRVVSVWQDGRVQTWNRTTGEASQPFRVPLFNGWGTPGMVDVDPTGATLAVATNRGTVERYDLATGERFGPLLPGGESQSLVAIASDGAIAVASGMWVRAWDAQGQLVGEVPTSHPSAVAVGERGERVVVSDYQGGLTAIDMRSGEVEGTHTAQLYSIQPLALQVLDEVFFVDGMGLQKWDPTTGDVSTSFPKEASLASMASSSMAFHSWNTDQTQLFDPDGGILLSLEAPRHPDWPMTPTAIAAGPDGVAWSTVYGHVLYATRDRTQVLTGAVPEIWGISGTGDALQVVTSRGTFQLGDAVTFDATPPTEVTSSTDRHIGWGVGVPGAKLKRRHERSLSGRVADCSDGARLLGADHGWDSASTLLVVDPAGKVIEADVEALGQTRLACHDGVGVVGTQSGSVTLVDTSDGAWIAGLPGDGSPVLALHVDGDALYVGHASGALRVWGLDGAFRYEQLFYDNGTTLAHDGDRLL